VATRQALKGAIEPGEVDVPGFYFNANTGLILVSTQILDLQKNLIGYQFYNVNPKTAVASLISTFFNNKNSDGDNFTGWFDVMSKDSKKVYRIGYRDVINQLDFGLGITDISTRIATTKWFSPIPIPDSLGPYISINLYGNSFISLAPGDMGNLNVVQWNLMGNSTIISQLDDAYITPYFGPIIEYMSSDESVYSALLVYDSWVSEDFNRWELILVDLPSGNTQQLVLWPWISAETDSVSGFGF